MCVVGRKEQRRTVGVLYRPFRCQPPLSKCTPNTVTVALAESLDISDCNAIYMCDESNAFHHSDSISSSVCKIGRLIADGERHHNEQLLLPLRVATR